MKKKLTISALLLAFILTIAVKVNAQSFIAAKSFIKNNNVYLRCVPNNYSTLIDLKNKGITIKRIAWEQNTQPGISDFTLATTISYISPLAQTDTNWATRIRKNEEAGFVCNLLYKPTNNKATDIDMVFGLAMLSCNFDIQLAKAAGLFYIDENASNGKYAYLIMATDPKYAVKIKPAILIVNAGTDSQLRNIDSLQISGKRKNVSLFWNEANLKNDYSGYLIERSEDDKNFIQLNKKPHIQVQSQYEKNKKDIYYNDTVPEYGKTYYFRVRGLNIFGISGSYSNTVKHNGVRPLSAFPLVDSTHLLNDTALQVNWHMPANFDMKELKGFDIYRSKESETVYKKINAELLTKETKSYTDLTPHQSNYYKVLAYNTAGDSAYSYALMGLVPDKTPPLVPLGLKGMVDTSGYVLLTWKPNVEKDLKGYRIFRNNDINEELVEITKTIITDTVFKDTITLETLTEEVYYSITGVDQVFNNSPYASPIKLKRPDKIKPLPAIFKELIHSDTAIAIKWVSSTSKDAWQYELWRNYGNHPIEKIKEWKAIDSLSEFIDLPPEYATYYQYHIKVTDDDGNFSTSKSAIHYFDSRVRKQIKKISYTINTEKKNLTLSWEYAEKELYTFIIYKAKKGEPLKVFKTLNGNTFTFEDKELYIGNEYEYRIKANFNSGAESYISDAVKIEF
jgi:hypothetical protein